jgi:hypothetical protein
MMLFEMHAQIFMGAPALRAAVAAMLFDMVFRNDA